MRDGKRVDKDKVKDHLRDNSAFICYAPYDSPKVALSIMIENGGDGSDTAAPIAARIIDRYLTLLDKQSAEASQATDSNAVNKDENNT